MASPPTAGFQRITFSIPATAAPGDRLVVWAYLPQFLPPAPRRPPYGSVVMANGLALPRSAGLPHLASRFSQAGFNVFLFDFRHLGDSTGVPRQLVSQARQLEDYLTVLRFVTEPRSHSRLFASFIDPSRVVLWGWSNSGGHVATLATHAKCPSPRFEPSLPLRISGVICLDPLCDGLANLKHHLWNRPLGLALLGPRILGDLVLSAIPVLNKRFSVNVPALGPGGFLASDEAARGARMMDPHQETPGGQGAPAKHATPVRGAKSELGPQFVNSVAARYGYEVMFQNSKGDSVNCPILISWSKDQGDGLITDQVPRAFLRHCQNLLSSPILAPCPPRSDTTIDMELKPAQESSQDRISGPKDHHHLPLSRPPCFIDSFEHEGDHFGLHFGGAGFEVGIQKQIHFLDRVIGNHPGRHNDD